MRAVLRVQHMCTHETRVQASICYACKESAHRMCTAAPRTRSCTYARPAGGVGGPDGAPVRRGRAAAGAGSPSASRALFEFLLSVSVAFLEPDRNCARASAYVWLDVRGVRPQQRQRARKSHAMPDGAAQRASTREQPSVGRPPTRTADPPRRSVRHTVAVTLDVEERVP